MAEPSRPYFAQFILIKCCDNSSNSIDCASLFGIEVAVTSLISFFFHMNTQTRLTLKSKITHVFQLSTFSSRSNETTCKQKCRDIKSYSLGSVNPKTKGEIFFPPQANCTGHFFFLFSSLGSPTLDKDPSQA